MSDDAFGHWLAGFIDGEGCFLIPQRGGRYAPCFSLQLRADDAAILHEIVARTAIGRVAPKSHAPTCPMVGWHVASRADCRALCAILDVHPLRAKKRRDFELWRDAVILWTQVRRTGGGPLAGVNADIWPQIAALKRALERGRRLVEVAA